MFYFRNYVIFIRPTWGYETSVKDGEIQNFILQEYSKPGSEENLTVGDVIRTFIGALNILQQNSNYNRAQIFGTSEVNSTAQSNTHSRFSSTER